MDQQPIYSYRENEKHLLKMNYNVTPAHSKESKYMRISVCDPTFSKDIQLRPVSFQTYLEPTSGV